MNKKALVMCLSYPSKNGRPKRFIHLLDELNYCIDVFSYEKNIANDKVRNQFYINQPSHSIFLKYTRRVKNLILSLLFLIFRSKKILSSVLKLRFNLLNKTKILLEKNYDLIIVQDLNLLPLANEIKKTARIIFDAREFYPLQNEESKYFKIIEKPQRMFLCNHFLSKCDKVVTVSPGIIEAYNNYFKLKPDLLRSTPFYSNIKYSKTSRSKIKMVHHGVANKNRNLGKMIEITNLLDERFTLDFYLTGSVSDISHIKNLSRDSTKVRVLDPVPYDEIVPTLTSYDIGFFYVEPTTFNLYNCLPNKLFEFIQARIAVAIGPSPDMAQLVNNYNCGFVSDFFTIDSMVKKLSTIDKELIDEAKFNSNIAAENLCYEKEILSLKRFIGE